MNFPAFLWFAVVSAVTPGPNNLMTLALGSRYGFKQGFRFGIGVGLGVLSVGGLCVAFGAVLIHWIPRVQQVMAYLGCGYILWLAYKLVIAKPEEDGPEGEPATAQKPSGILAGILLQFINPKFYLYIFGAYSMFIFPYTTQPGMLILCLLILTAIVVADLACWAAFGSVFQRFYKSHFKAVNMVMALSLVVCAAALLFE